MRNLAYNANNIYGRFQNNNGYPIKKEFVKNDYNFLKNTN